MFNRRPQSAKLAHGYRSTGGTSAGGKSTFNFRKKLERQILDSDMISNRKNQLAGNFLAHQEQVGKLMPRYVPQSPERLYEQNLILKKEVNALQTQIQLLKGKVEAEKRKALKYTSQLDVQYEKEIFWAGPHMVTGVKRQYERLKQQLEAAQKQLQEARRVRDFTDVQELTVQRDQYKLETERLMERLSELAAQAKYPDKQDRAESSYEHSYSNEEQVVWNKRRSQTAANNNSLMDDYEQEILKLQTEKSTLHSKIEFLQTQLVEKENNEFAINTSNRKLTQEIERLKVLNQQLGRDVESERDLLRLRVQEVREAQKKYQPVRLRRHEQEVLLFNEEMSSKKAQIVKLEKQIGYLSTLLSYWKPLDEQEELRTTIKQHPQQQQNEITLPETIIGRERVISFKKESQISQLSAFSETGEKNPLEKSIRLAKVDSTEIQTETKIPAARSLLTDSKSKTKKNYSLKRSKVKKEEVALIGEEIKYKLLDSGVEFNEAKKLLEGAEGRISIGELVQIFTEAPFNVKNEQSAVLMARYLVEDQNDQVIFYDASLSGDCVIVRSIFEQVVPRYRTPTAEQTSLIRESVRQLLLRYNNLLVQTIAGQVGPKCILTKQKLVEVLTQQELNQGPESVDYMVGLLLKDSADINHLEFRKLADRVESDQP